MSSPAISASEMAKASLVGTSKGSTTEIISALSKKVAELEAEINAMAQRGSRKNEEAADSDSEEFYRGLFEHLPIAAAVSRLDDGTLLAANKAYADEVQMSREEMLGKTSRDLGFWMGESLREEFVESLERDGRTVRLDLHHHPINGRKRQYHLRATRLPVPRQDAIAVALVDRTLEHLFEQQVQASEKRYRSVVEELYDARIIHGPDGTVHDANDRACALLGTHRSQLTERGWKAFLPPGELIRYQARLDQLDERPALVFESKVKRPDGIEVEVEVSALRIEPGAHAPVMVLLRDISARKQVEKMLLESERRFRQIADHVGDIFWVAVLPASEVLYVNLAFEEVFGRARSELYRNGKLWQDWMINAEGSDPFKVIERGTFYQEYRIRRPDGSERWLQTRTVVVKSEGEAEGVTRIVGIATDVTAWKESTSLVERVGLGLSARFGADFLQHLTGELAAALHADYAHIGELHSDQPGWIQPVVEYAAFENAGKKGTLTLPFELKGTPSAEVLENSVQIYSQDLSQKFPNDARIAAIGAEGYVGARLIDSQGAVVGLVEVMYRKRVENAGAAQSVLQIFASRASAELERLKAEAVARLRQEQLQQTDKLASLGVLSAGIAHEINNPNNLSMFNADLLGKVWADIRPILESHASENPGLRLAGLPFAEMREEVGALIDGMRGGAERIRDIVSGLKEFARPEIGRREKTVDLRDVMRRTLIIAGNLLRQATDRFEWKPGSGALPLVLGNPQQLEQVLINLLQNACDALPDRHRSIRVEEGFDHAQVWLKVIDEGEGLEAGALEKLHVPFFTTKRSRGGTGLGLPVCFSIVQAHQGQLKFESEPGKGTVAILTLPRWEET
jgi:PAS domain S-box-containing protein